MMVRTRFDKDLPKMEKRTARENVTNNPCLEIFLRTLWADKWEDSITVVITGEHLKKRSKETQHFGTSFSFQKVAHHECYKLKTDKILEQVIKEIVYGGLGE